MLNREFLGNAGITAGEFVRFVSADGAELTPFEKRLFNLALVAVTAAENAVGELDLDNPAANDVTDPETMGGLAALGELADRYGFDDEQSFIDARGNEDKLFSIASDENLRTLEWAVKDLEKAIDNVTDENLIDDMKADIERLESISSDINSYLYGE